MAKKNRAPLPREVTRRRLARWQQEKRRRRITITIGAIVIAAIIIIVGYGFYSTSFAPQREWITKVGSGGAYTVFHSSDYVEALRLIELGFYSPSSTESEAPLLVLETAELVRQGAREEGLPAVTDADITQEIKDTLFPEEDAINEAAYKQFLTANRLSESEFEGIMEVQILIERLELHVTSKVPAIGEILPHVHLQGVEVATEALAADAQQRLDNGEDFAIIMAAYNGGDMGWLPQGAMKPSYEDIIFNMEIGDVSQSLASDAGYTIVQLLGKEDRALDETTRSTLEDSALDRWIEEQREEKVVRNPGIDLEAKYEWAMEQIS